VRAPQRLTSFQAKPGQGAAERAREPLAVLENCTEATSAANDKRRLKTGITGPAMAAAL